MPSLLDRMFAGNQFGAESMSAAYRNRYPTTPPPQSGTSALANFGQMLPGLVGDYMDAQTANKALTAAETAKRQRELYFNQLEEQRLKEQGGPLASRSGPQAGPLERPDGFMMDIPSGPLETSGQSYESMLNRGRAQYPTDIAQIREEEIKKRTRATAEATQKAAAKDTTPLSGPGSLSRTEFLAETKPEDFTPESYAKAVESGRIGDLDPVIEGPDVTDELAVQAKYDKATAPAFEVFSSYDKLEALFSMPIGEGGGARDVAMIFGFMKANDPGSTVREGEFATVRNAAGVPEAMRALYNQALGKGILTDISRKQVINVARTMANTRIPEATKLRQKFVRQAARYGMPAELFSEVPKEYKASTTGGTPANPASGGYSVNPHSTQLYEEQGLDPQNPDDREKMLEHLRRKQAGEELRSLGS